jgi:origin recognition complex subunit 6
MTAIRSLCKAFDIPHAAPHVYVGVSSIARVVREQQAAAAQTPAKKRPRRSTGKEDISAVVAAFDETHIPALIVVVAFFTRSHLIGAPEASEYASQRADAIQTVTKTTPDDVRTDEETTIAMIENLLREAENGWLDMEWYHNLPEPEAGPEDVADDLHGPNNDGDDIIERSTHGLQVPNRGSGSMMTDATDYLSDERRAEYKRWKSEILLRIAQIEKQDRGKAIKV